VLIVKDKKAVVFKLKEPTRITAVIPTARLLSPNIVAVPHQLDETKVLRNLGFEVPSPIKSYYEWPGLFTPFFAQKETSDFLTMNHRSFCLNDLGTGKTMSALWAYDFLRSKGKVRKVLVVSPLSTLERTWADEVFRNFPHLEFAVLHGSKDRRLKLLKQNADVYLVNHHGIKIIQEALAKRDDIDLIIIDEISQVCRNPASQIWKSLNDVCVKQLNGLRKVWGLTGTPTPNAPTDVWGQVRIVNPHNVTPYFKRFKESIMKQVSPFIWVPKPDAVQVVKDAMQPAIRFTRDQCIDLPPCIHIDRAVELTADQRRAYNQMLNQLRTEIDGGQVVAVNEAVKMSKLVQIACGVAYGRDGQEVTTAATPRLEVTYESIIEADSKAIVFVPFVSSIGAVTQYLIEKGLTVACIYGSVSKHDRDAIFSAFQKAEEPRVIVAIPSAMSHGLTLTAASTIIWYAPVCSNETYEQANGRITRPGQKKTQVIVNIEGTAVERKIYERLKNKQKIQGSLLSLVEDDNLQE
jgi:SNF2 family DNA or RNA helicase